MREQQITEIIIGVDHEGRATELYSVGNSGVTRIEATTKPGEYSHIPYIRVWKGEILVAEFCQHKILGVYFGDVTLTGG